MIIKKTDLIYICKFSAQVFLNGELNTIRLCNRLGLYFITVFIGLLIHGAITLPLTVKILGNGVELTFAQQLIVIFTALLAAIGSAGIPMAGLIMMTVVLKAVGLPLEGIGLILAVDRLLDMFRYF